MQVRRNRAAFPRAWVVHDFRTLGQIDVPQSALRDALVTRLRASDRSTLSDPRSPAFLREIAYLETDRPEMLTPYLTGDAGIAEGSEAVSVRYEASTRAVLRARLQRPGIVVLADAFDPGWRLTIDGQPAPVLRANLLMRGAAVPAGSHELVYTYMPTSFLVGAWVGLLGLAGLVGLAFWARRKLLARDAG